MNIRLQGLMSDLEKPLAVVIKGNPERMVGQEKRAADFYNDIGNYLTEKGFRVEYDPGEDFTCPDKTAAIWVAHSRGTGRIRCIDKGSHNRFAKLGSPDGAIADDDLAWHREMMKRPDGEVTPEDQPPKSHFIFSSTMRKEIDKTIKAFNKL